MAQEIADSKLLDTWGSGGAKIEPDITKIIEGWQLGEQPPHEYMNWLQNTFGSKLNHILKNGVASWNVKTEYLAGATVQRNGNVWICKTTNTNSEPTDVNNNWDKIPSIENLALTVDTIDVFPASATTGDTCIVKDLDRGGIFIYDSTKVNEDNQGTNFNGWIRQYSGAVNVKWFGAKGDWDGTTGTDDTLAIQKTINYCRDNKLMGELEQTSMGYRITSPLMTQHDSFYASLAFNFNNTPIVCDFSGDSGLIVTGGVPYQYLHNINIMPSDFYKLSSNSDYANKDTSSHGIRIINTRVEITGVSSGFRGYALYYSSTNFNSNASKLDIKTNFSHVGAYFDGSDDNISLMKLTLKTYGNASYGLFTSASTPIRQWDGWVYAENNCQASFASSFSAVHIEKSYFSDWKIYSEQGNSALEIYFGPDSYKNSILSFRQNKDMDAGTAKSNMWKAGSLVYRPDRSRIGDIMEVNNSYARVSQNNEYVGVRLSGYGGSFGFLRGYGDGGGNQSMRMLASDETLALSIDKNKVSISKPLAISHDTIIDGSNISTKYSISKKVTTTSAGSTTSVITVPSNKAIAGVVYITCRASGGVYWSYVFDIYTNNSSFVATSRITGNSGGTHSCSIQLIDNQIKVVESYTGGNGNSVYTYITGEIVVGS